MGSSVPVVSDAELEVIKALWAGGPGTIRDLEARLRKRRRRWAYNTVSTLLSRLRDKGFVSADKTGAAHIFRPMVSRDQFLRLGLTELADRVCDGTSSPLLHALVQGRQWTPKDIAELRRMLDEMDGKD